MLSAPNCKRVFRSALSERPAGFIDENGGGPGVRLRKRQHRLVNPPPVARPQHQHIHYYYHYYRASRRPPARSLEAGRGEDFPGGWLSVKPKTVEAKRDEGRSSVTVSVEEADSAI
jgi:hypothetical protein